MLLIAVQLAGFSWGEVDKFRKAMSKKIREEMVKYRQKFIDGCAENGIESEGRRADLRLHRTVRWLWI